MKTLKPPSLQHMARIVHIDPTTIAKRLLGMVEHGPTFSYQPLFDAVREHFALRTSIQDILLGFERIQRQSLRDDFIAVLKLLDKHFKGNAPDYVKGFTALDYPIARDIRIPFNPPFIYGQRGVVHIPWFSFWRSQPLSGEKLSLFVNLARELIAREPDLNECQFHILDLHVRGPGKHRQLKEIDCSTVPLLLPQRKEALLSAFAHGYRTARSSLDSRLTERKAKDAPEDQHSFDWPRTPVSAKTS